MTGRPFRHSFKVWAQDQDWPELREVWIEADRGGFWDAVWLNDHLYPPRAEESRPIMDSWTLFGGLAAVTTRIRFGTMLTANTFRHPALLAKQAVTLDRMSQGRLELGVGAGWHEREHEAFDIDLRPVRERFDMLEETFQILHGLMTEEVFDFKGKYRTITSAHFEPKPVQKPRPPFVIGGSGPRRTIPLAARWADQWNYPDFSSEPELFVASLRRLDEACEEIGRERSEIEVSVQFRYPGDPSETADLAATYRELGANHVLVSFMPPTSTDLPPRIAEALGVEVLKYLIPVAGERLPRRITQLLIGLVLFGIGIGLMLQSGMGVPPWDVLHQGLARRFGLTVGAWSIIVSVAVLLLWLPLRQPYGLGTLLNAIIIGVVIDLTGVVIPAAEVTGVAWSMMLGGVVLIGIASGLYIGANLGPGPRDGLMTGIARKGPSIRLTRAVIEITVLTLGWILGGTFGIGTIVFALAIGPLVQYFLPRWDISPHPSTDAWEHLDR